MEKCSFETCNKDAIGGYKEELVATNLQTLEGEEETVGNAYYWCAEHEAEMQGDFADVPGREIKIHRSGHV